MYKLIEYQLITEYTKKDALPELEEPLYRQKLVVFSGAGISVESGIPSYRDCSGKWVAEDPEEYATAAAFYENPQKVLDYYNKLRRAVYDAIGTSLRVSPASLIVKYPHHSVPKYSINVADLSDRLPDNYIQIQETATKGIDKFIVELTKL